MREREFDDTGESETSDDHLDEKQVRKMQKEMNRKLKKKKKGSIHEDGFSTHKKEPYKREKFDPRDHMR